MSGSSTPGAAAGLTPRSSPYQSSIPTPRGSPRPCQYLKTRGASILHKLVAMATCSARSKGLVNKMKEELSKLLPMSNIVTPLPPPPSSPSPSLPLPLLSCSTCQGHMVKPVCLPCGHSHCVSCLKRASELHKTTLTCSRCQETHPQVPVGFESPRKPTLILQTVSLKHYPVEMSVCCEERERGNEFAQSGDFEMALLHYNKALETGYADHRVYSNMSRAHLALGRPHEALANAEESCSLHPSWPKGHYRRGRALSEMKRFQEATAAYLLSLHLGGGELQCVCQSLDHVLSGQKYSSTDLQQLMESILTLSVQGFKEYWRLATSRGPLSLQLGDNGVDIGEFDCVLCAGLLFQPVTVPCGHSFCRECLARLFDHSPYCPVCRASLGEMFMQHTQSSGQMCIDQVMEQVIQHLFSALYEERKSLFLEERIKLSRIGLNEEEDLPIFVCTMTFPSQTYPLHIFEPRYRLMMRRCIESNSRRFGMCAPLDREGQTYVDYGTILFISSLEYTPDGRSLVTTVGERRFQVLERKTRDGYAVARIKFLSDEIDPDQESLDALQSEVYEHCIKWLQALPVFTRLMIMQAMSSPPPNINDPPTSHDGPLWVWWFVNAMPVTLRSKLEFLKCLSLRERLRLLKEILPLPST